MQQFRSETFPSCLWFWVSKEQGVETGGGEKAPRGAFRVKKIVELCGSQPGRMAAKRSLNSALVGASAAREGFQRLMKSVIRH